MSSVGHDIRFIDPKCTDDFPIDGEGVLIKLGRRRPGGGNIGVRRQTEPFRTAMAGPVHELQKGEAKKRLPDTATDLGLNAFNGIDAAR